MGTPWEQSAIILIQHSSVPDIIVRHKFEMSLMSFVCNFGGLLGMWLGFSVLSISKDVFNSIRRFSTFNGNKINLITLNNFKLNLHLIKFKIFNKKSNVTLNQNNLPRVGID